MVLIAYFHAAKKREYLTDEEKQWNPYKKGHHENGNLTLKLNALAPVLHHIFSFEDLPPHFFCRLKQGFIKSICMVLSV